MKKVDETIEAVCDWVQRTCKEEIVLPENATLPRMVKALAELVSARNLCNIWESDLLEKIETDLKTRITEDFQNINHGFHY